MFNPPSYSSDPDNSYFGLKARISKRMPSSKQLFDQLASSFKDALKDELLVLSRAEHQRLLEQICTDLAEELKSAAGRTPP